MRIGIIGNGLAGTMAAKAIRESDPRAEVVLLTGEKYRYYPRPNLIEFIAGSLAYERLFAFPEAWYAQKGIELRLGAVAERVLPESLEAEVRGGERLRFEALLLADGASASVPPIRGSEKRRVFTLRTLDDALEILNALEKHKDAAVVGGGLLGLETARALNSRGARVTVVEFFDRLLPRQLDVQGAALLKTQIERTGIAVRLGLATDEILGEGEVAGLRFKDGSTLKADLALIAAGVKPNIGLARGAGLSVDRGVVVDDTLRTSHPQIFAAGDGTQHQGRIYGIIPASFEQSQVAAANILGQGRIYGGTVPSNTLKVVGLYVTSVGLVNPEGQGFEEVRKHDAVKGIYKKIVLQDGRLVGAIWMGTKEGVPEVSRAVLQKAPLEEKWKGSILEDGFDFRAL